MYRKPARRSNKLVVTNPKLGESAYVKFLSRTVEETFKNIFGHIDMGYMGDFRMSILGQNHTMSLWGAQMKGLTSKNLLVITRQMPGTKDTHTLFTSLWGNITSITVKSGDKYKLFPGIDADNMTAAQFMWDPTDDFRLNTFKKKTIHGFGAYKFDSTISDSGKYTIYSESCNPENSDTRDLPSNTNIYSMILRGNVTIDFTAKNLD